jgi:hypothetical protein
MFFLPSLVLYLMMHWMDFSCFKTSCQSCEGTELPCGMTPGGCINLFFLFVSSLLSACFDGSV